MKRFFKHLIYGLFYLAVFLGIAIPVYFLSIKPVSSCFDRIQNQDEQGIDCGGVCAKVCIPTDIQNIKVVGIPQAFNPDGKFFSLLARIQNPNLGFAASSFKYTFTIYDLNGKSFEISDFSHLYAGESTYLTIFQKPQDKPLNPALISRIDLTFSAITWVPAVSYTKPETRLQQFQTTQLPDSIHVDGVLENTDALPLSRVGVVALFFGRFGQMVGFGQTTLDNFSPNELRSFTIIHPKLVDFIATSTQVVVLPPSR